MKYLIVGLGNVGREYEGTRHNIGFMVLDNLIKESKEISFSLERHAFRAEMRWKGRTMILIKPTTYMNLSGKAVKYWLDKEKIPIENILVIVDDLALPVGSLRMKKSGSDGGHNGLHDIIYTLASDAFTRLRFGIGNNFSKGRQVDYVLNPFSTEDLSVVEPKIEQACEMIRSFITVGVEKTMNAFNNK